MENTVTKICRVLVARVAVLLLLLSQPCLAEDGFSTEGSLRLRGEYVDWYDQPQKRSDYDFLHSKLQLGLRYKHSDFELFGQAQHFQLYDLPLNGVGPGAAYRVTNGNDGSPGDLILRQLELTYRPSESSYYLGAGRMLFANGGEHKNSDPALEQIKKSRIANRVLGTFEFTGGRSFDGVRGDVKMESVGNLALSAFHPTQGGFSTEGSIQIQDIDVLTVAFTPAETVRPERSDIQLFYYLYRDQRENTLVVDNRPLDVRNQEELDIELHNFGAHFVKFFNYGDIRFHGLTWGILQGGSWGSNDVLAGAFTTEMGAKLESIPGKPLFEIGYTYGSGDGDATDGEHRTFMQMLPTAWQYARLPVYNMMNNQDLFLAASIDASETVRMQGAIHSLWLADRGDLLYGGGGANLKEQQFGFTGTPIATQSIGSLVDIMVNYQATPTIALSLYGGHLFSSDSALRGGLTYGFFEVVTKF